MFVNDENPEVFEQLNKNKALFELNPEENNPVDSTESLEPTLENLQKALNAKVTSDKEYLHEASKIKFKLCAMSSSGYTALNNVAKYNPLTQAKISTDQEDERERTLVYLTNGVSKPKLTRQSAQMILDAPGWGPSNIGLVDAITKINPSAEQRVNNFMVLMGLARFQIIWFRVMEETGGLDKYCADLKIKDDIKESLRTCMYMFSHLFAIDETARSWGLELGIGGITNDTEDENEEIIEETKSVEKTDSDEVLSTGEVSQEVVSPTPTPKKSSKAKD